MATVATLAVAAATDTDTDTTMDITMVTTPTTGEDAAARAATPAATGTHADNMSGSRDESFLSPNNLSSTRKKVTKKDQMH